MSADPANGEGEDGPGAPMEDDIGSQLANQNIEGRDEGAHHQDAQSSSAISSELVTQSFPLKQHEKGVVIPLAEEHRIKSDGS